MTEALTWLQGNPGKLAATIAVLLVLGLLALLADYLIERRK